MWTALPVAKATRGRRMRVIRLGPGLQDWLVGERIWHATGCEAKARNLSNRSCPTLKFLKFLIPKFITQSRAKTAALAAAYAISISAFLPSRGHPATDETRRPRAKK